MCVYGGFFSITVLCRQDTCRHRKVQKIRKVKLSGISKVIASSIYSGMWIAQIQSSLHSCTSSNITSVPSAFVEKEYPHQGWVVMMVTFILTGESMVKIFLCSLTEVC